MESVWGSQETLGNDSGQCSSCRHMEGGGAAWPEPVQEAGSRAECRHCDYMPWRQESAGGSDEACLLIPPSALSPLALLPFLNPAG